jgi:hypothetical protein
MTRSHSLRFFAGVLLFAGSATAQQDDPKPPVTDDGAALEIEWSAPEMRANSAEADAWLAKLEASHKGILQYSYQAQVGVQVMMSGGGGTGDPMQASFIRKGSVLQGGPLGTLIHCNKSLELPGLSDGPGGAMMDESSTVLVRKADLMIDYKASQMAAMTGGPQGLTKITKKDLQALRETMPMPAPMDFVMMHSPAFADPRDFVRALTEQTAWNQLTTKEEQVVLSGMASAGFLPPMGPDEDALAELEVRMTLDAKTARLQKIELGPAAKPRMTLRFSDYGRPEAIDAKSFDLNPDGKEVKDLAPILRAQFEQMATFGGGGSHADDEDEF